MAICPSFLRGRRMRVTRLDSCGRPVAGAGGFVATKGFITLEMTPEVEEGEEITQKNAAGELCISDKACDQIKWWNFTATFCNVDIDLALMLNPTWNVLLDENGDPIGWGENNDLSCDAGFALEVWTEAANVESACDNPDAQGAWGYLVLPWAVGGVPSDQTIENGAVTFGYTGRTKVGSKWGVGPYNVRLDPTDSTPKPLPAIVQPKQPRLFMITTMAPPADQCGSQTLTPITPPALEITSAIEDTSDVTRKTVKLSWTNWGAGPVSIDWDDGGPMVVTGPDTGTLTHLYVANAAHDITVTDADQPLRTATVTVTTPYV